MINPAPIAPIPSAFVNEQKSFSRSLKRFAASFRAASSFDSSSITQAEPGRSPRSKNVIIASSGGTGTFGHCVTSTGWQ